MRGLRICMLTTFYPPNSFGGDGIAVQRLARALVRHGHQVTVVCDLDAFRALHAGPLPDCRPMKEDEGVTVICLESRLGALSPLLVQQCGRPVVHAARLRRLLAPGQWDVVNFHNVSLLGGPGILRYPSDAVTLYMAHEHWLVCPTHVLWRYQRERCDRRECLRCLVAYRRPPQLWRYTGALQRALREVDVVVAMSEFSRAKHREFGLEREMEVLPQFMPPADVTRPVSVVAPHARPYFFFAGRLERAKGLDDVIAAFARYPHADLLIAGEGSHGQALRALAAGMPNVHFLGQRPAEVLGEYFRHAVATLVPSKCFETFGLVIIEALREGSPVVARRVGPFPELLAQAGAGELFDGPDDLLGCLDRVQSDPAYRASLVAAARESVATRWSESAVLPAYLGMVARAASHRGRGDIVTRLAGHLPPVGQ